MVDEPDKQLFFVSTKAITPCYAAIGHATSAWSWFEHLVDLTIAKMADENIDVVFTLLAQLGSIHAKFEALIAIIQSEERSVIHKHLVKKLVRFSNEIRPLTIRRNRIIHDPVILEHGVPKTIRLTTKGDGGRLVYSLENFDMSEVTDFIAKMHDKTEEFKKIRDEIRAALATTRRQEQPVMQPEE
jgi:hypothetical protein